MKFKISGYTKSSLIDKITKGDEKAFRLLFDTYYQQLFHHAFYYLASKEQAEECKICNGGKSSAPVNTVVVKETPRA